MLTALPGRADPTEDDIGDVSDALEAIDAAEPILEPPRVRTRPSPTLTSREMNPYERPRRRISPATLMVVFLFMLLFAGIGALLIAIPMGGLAVYLDYTADGARAIQEILSAEKEQIQQENQVLVEDVAMLGEEMEASIGRERKLRQEVGGLKSKVSKQKLTAEEIEAQLVHVEEQLATTQEELSSIHEQLMVAQKKLVASNRAIRGYEAFDKLIPNAKRTACEGRSGQRQCEETVMDVLLAHKSDFLACAAAGDIPTVQTLSSRAPEHYVVLGKGALSSVALALCDLTLPDDFAAAPSGSAP